MHHDWTLLAVAYTSFVDANTALQTIKRTTQVSLTLLDSLIPAMNLQDPKPLYGSARCFENTFFANSAAQQGQRQWRVLIHNIHLSLLRVYC